MKEKLLKDRTVGLIVFSYKAPLTLAASFDSYRRSGLLDYVDDACVLFIGSHKADHAVAEDFGARYIDCDETAGFEGALEEMTRQATTDYVLWVEHDCKIWGKLSREQLREQMDEALGVLDRDAADLVRLRHSWLGNPRISAASIYSRYYEISQLSSHWRNGEDLSQAPAWVKWLRRMWSPLRARRWIGRSVYVEENPHLIHPRYIRKDGNIFIVDSAVFQWSNQPSLFSRDFMLRGREKWSAAKKVRSPVISPSAFVRAINTSDWRKAHYRVAVAPGIFTWTGGSAHCS